MLKIIIVLEFVQELGTRDGKIPAAEAFQGGSRFPFKCAGDQRLSGDVVLIGELDLRHIASWGGRIDEHRGVTTDEALPFKIGRNALRGGDHLRIHGFLAVGLPADILIKGCHGLLNGPNDVGLELRERVLHRQEITTIVIFLQNLLMQAIPYTSLKNIRVVVGIYLASRTGGMLAEKFDMLLGDVPSLFDML